MRPLSIHLLAFMLLLLLPALAAAFEPARIVVVPGPVSATQLRLEVSGIWPDTCTPQLASVSSQGRDVRLLAVRESAGCRSTPTPYAFSTEAFEPQQLLPGEGIHRVRLLIEDADGSSGRLAGFALLQDGTQTAATLETGFWWAEQGGEFDGGPGLGLSVETQAGLISLSAMGYDAEGRSAWYFGAGELHDGIARLELGQFEGGAGPFSGYAAPESIRFSGWVDVEVQSPSRAVLWFSRVDAGGTALELKPLSITRFSFAQNPGEALLGRWLVAGSQASERDSRWLHFSRSEEFEGGFVLHEADGQARLQCDLPGGLSAATPSICRLELDDGDAIEFSEIGLRRLAGWDAELRRTVAVRLD